MIKKLLFLSFIISAFTAFSQGEQNIWYFGENAGLDFNTNPATPLSDSAMNTIEGCSTICDEQGNLLFYTEGSVIFNANHTVMDNGDGLLGSQSSAQSSLILSDPVTPGLYYLFCVGYRTPVYYSVINMNANNGEGSVLMKNISLASNSSTQSVVHEKITATINSTNDGYWVCTFGDNTYRSYEVSGGGLVQGSLNLSASSINFTDPADVRGMLKFSPDGGKIINTSMGGGAIIADFDNSTGTVTNTIALSNPNSSGVSFYGAEFSQNSDLLYLDFNSSPNGNFCTTSGRRQILVYSLNGSQNWNSDPIVLWSGINEPRGDLKLGPDGNIYVARSCQQWLGIITNPNNLNLVSYYPNGLQLANGTQSREGLPNTVQVFGPTAGLKTTMDNLIKVFPNPTSGILQLQAKNTIKSLTIHDLNGRMLNKTSFVSGTLNETVDLENLNSGIYLITVETSEGQTTERVVVK